MSEVDGEQKIYRGKIDLSVRNNSHTIMHDLILESCKRRSARILEVGCASGYFGEALKKRGFEVWGVEICPDQAASAAERMDYVYKGGIESFIRSEKAREAPFDYIVFGDVLEHLERPSEVLRACAEILVPDGAVIASIPNVAHLAVRLMLLEGRWEYAPFGIMDDTHLRFFTRRSVIQQFEAAGLEVEALDAVRLPVEAVGIQVNHALAAAVRPFIADDDQDIFQYVVMARKASGEGPAKASPRFLPGSGLGVLCLLPFAEWSVGDIRLRNPLQKWAREHGGRVRIKSIYEYAPADLEWADVVILQRESSPFVLSLISAVKRLGKAVILDMDDLLTDVPSFLSVHAHTERNRKYLEDALRAVSAVTVTTEELRRRMTAYNKNVRIVPNCASSSHMPASHDDSGETSATLIVASSDTVRVEFVVKALARLQKDPDIRIRILGIGPPGEYLSEAGLEVLVQKNMGYEPFKALLASTDNAIGVIPLDDSEFSSCKSAIKYVDYSLAGIPAVCSAVKPYSDVIEHGITGILVENEEEAWFREIKALVLSPETRRRISRSAREFCLAEFNLGNAARKWQEAFASVTSSGGGQVDAGAPSVAARRRSLHVAKVLMRHSVRPSSYGFVLRVISAEGRAFFKNVLLRLKTHLMAAR